jgi:two-component system, NtrC family, sensor kinase
MADGKEGGVSVEARASTREELAEKRLERASISDAERLVEAVVLVEGIIHRINNPLASLLLGLSQLAEQLALSGRSSEQAASLRAALEARADGERVAAAVRELRSLFPSDAPRRVDAQGVLASVMSLLEQQRWGTVVIERKFGLLLPVFVREARFAQVLRSAGQLFIDALHASVDGRGDELALRVEAQEEDNELVIKLLDPEAQKERLSVLLTDPSERLSILNGMVQQLGGSLSLRESMLELRLPVEAPAFDSESEVDLTRRSSVPPRGEMRILVIDDEPSIHRALARGLSTLGLVQSVRSMASAIELLEGGATFDVILADLIMPEGTGLEFFEWLGRRDAKLKRRMILMTGMGETHADSHPDIMVVSKPFDLPALRELVCQVATRG